MADWGTRTAAEKRLTLEREMGGEKVEEGGRGLEEGEDKDLNEERKEEEEMVQKNGVLGGGRDAIVDEARDMGERRRGEGCREESE